ncbi:uncharacterized protein V1516DRAFT_680968 [Lipomyces oligophaga]|uniref:uncharacterized protein n=1 Tax=Lipomyces oligophaga TaxID=45792 RepID=UPI0034CE0981
MSPAPTTSEYGPISAPQQPISSYAAAPRERGDYGPHSDLTSASSPSYSTGDRGRQTPVRGAPPPVWPNHSMEYTTQPPPVTRGRGQIASQLPPPPPQYGISALPRPELAAEYSPSRAGSQLLLSQPMSSQTGQLTGFGSYPSGQLPSNVPAGAVPTVSLGNAGSGGTETPASNLAGAGSASGQLSVNVGGTGQHSGWTASVLQPSLSPHLGPRPALGGRPLGNSITVDSFGRVQLPPLVFDRNGGPASAQAKDRPA